MTKAIIGVLLLTAVLSGCGTKDYKITGEQTIGIVKDYNKQDPQKQMERTVLTKYVPEMIGEVSFADVKVLGEVDGKTYTINVIASYSEKDNKIMCVDSKSEYAAFTEPSEANYEATEDIFASEQFLPESLRQKEVDTFDRYVYTIGEKKGKLQADAEEYFSEN